MLTAICNATAEVSVLSTTLHRPDLAIDICSELKPQHFGDQRHRAIFSAACSLCDNHRPVDLANMIEELKRARTMDRAGGYEYVLELADICASGAEIESHCRIVRDKSKLRKFWSLAEQWRQKAEAQTAEAQEMIDIAEDDLFHLNIDRRSRIAPVSAHLAGIINSLDEKRIDHIPTGFFSVDEILYGFAPQELVIVAGRPSMGKSAFVVNVALSVVLEQLTPVCIFSLEMSSEQIIRNMLLSISGVNGHKFSRREIDQKEYGRITNACSTLDRAPLYIDDTPGLTPRQIRAEVRRQVKKGCKVFFVDYLQLMESSERHESVQAKTAYLSKRMKAIAKEFRVTMVVLSQLNRSVEAREDKRPRMSDLRDSGALEQDGDKIVFLYRDEYYNPDTADKGIAEVIIAKHRNGPIGTAKLAFHRQCVRFAGLASHYKAV